MTFLLSAVWYIGYLTGCASGTVIVENERTVQRERLETSEPTCPRGLPDGTDLGIVIALPDAVVVAPGERHGMCGVPAMVPVCGYYMLPVLEAMDDSLGLRVNIVPEEGGQEMMAPLGDCDPSTAEPPPEDPDSGVDRSALEGMASGGEFRHNIFDTIRIPAGVYRVTARYGSYESNTETLRLVFDP